MTISKLLIVDDDIEMRQMMASYLQNSGFMVYQGANLADLTHYLNEKQIDLILLDVMLEYENGIDICKKIREEHNLPIIMVSALSSDHHRMSGYAVGADDYVAKPFNSQLLLARVNAVLNRVQRSPSLLYRRDTATYEFAGWTYESRTREVFNAKGVLIALSQKELKLLQVLLANPHIALTREEIIEAMDKQEGDKNTSGQVSKALDVLIGRIRQKIEDDPKNPKLIKTVRNIGYMFSASVKKIEHG